MPMLAMIQLSWSTRRDCINARIQSGAHEMSCTPNDPSHPTFRSNQFVAGNNESPNCPDCQNNPARTNVPFHGPLPATEYSIGPQHGLSRRDRSEERRVGKESRTGES